MTLEKINIMGNIEDDDYGRVIIPGQGPEMPAEENSEDEPEMGDDPGVQIENPEPEKEDEKMPPPPEKIEEIIRRKPKLPN